MQGQGSDAGKAVISAGTQVVSARQHIVDQVASEIQQFEDVGTGLEKVYRDLEQVNNLPCPLFLSPNPTPSP